VFFHAQKRKHQIREQMKELQRGLQRQRPRRAVGKKSEKKSVNYKPLPRQGSSLYLRIGRQACIAAYDIKKLRGKDLLSKLPESRRYSLPPQAVPTIAALVIIREKLLRPTLAASANPLSDTSQPAVLQSTNTARTFRQDMLILMRD
jgi:hypothetical protein